MKISLSKWRDRLEAGAVFHNNQPFSVTWPLDFPGLKESGVSRETRHCGLEFLADSYGFADWEVKDETT